MALDESKESDPVVGSTTTTSVDADKCKTLYIFVGRDKRAVVVPEGCSLAELKRAVGEVVEEKSDAPELTLMVDGERLATNEGAAKLGDGTVVSYSVESDLLPDAGMKMAEVEERVEYGGKALIFVNPKDETDKISVATMHVSCRSHKIPLDLKGVSMSGMAIYRYDGKLKWELNGMRCRSGYIVLRSSKSWPKPSSESGVSSYHSQLFKKVFDVDLSTSPVEIIGAGFSIIKGEYRYRSHTFNTRGDGWHDTEKECHKLEKKFIQAALDNWRFKGEQNVSAAEVFDSPEAACDVL